MRLIGFAALLALGACSSPVTPVVGCATQSGITPICEFQNPEDIVVTPSGRWLLISQMAAFDDAQSGSLVAYQPASERVEILFPVGEFDDVRAWGEPDCAPPLSENFAPHGIDLQLRADGILQLLAVNHGARETIEFFAVEESDAGLALHWRGCVLAPGDAYLNDVVVSRAGGFWATDMLPLRAQWWALLKAIVFGAATGRVYHWHPAEGYAVVAGSEMQFPNGIAKSQDERTLYVASFLGDAVHAIDLASAAVTRMPIRRPDNITWDANGKLLVASHTDSLRELMMCRDLLDGACGSAFEIVEIDPAAATSLIVLAHRGAPLGGVSVAVQLGGDLYLGSVAGDRIARWRWAP